MHTCPVCLGHPGSLPTINEQAIRYALMIAAALECDVARRSVFARKNYFYPDLPKGYQISQYDEPIAVNGRLGDVRVHRAHLEEDAAKLNHVGESGRIHGSGASLVDFNRGGTPLVEIVTEPDLRSPAQAREWAQLLRTTIRQLGVSDVNMEEGSLRVDGNISIRPAGSDELGTKTELKNMNSFRFLERGIEAEIARQREVLESGEEVAQETFHFHPEDGSLTPLRSKEYAHDYRYFPEPDLVPVVPTEQMLKEARESLPELPAARRERYVTEIGLSEHAASTLAFNAEFGEYFERAVAAGDGIPRRGDRQLGHRGAGRRTASGRCGGGPTRVEGDARRPSPRWPVSSRPRRSPTAPASGSWRSWSRRAEIPHRSWRRRASPRSRTPRSSRGSSSARSRPSPRPPIRSAKATRRRSAESSER